MVACANTDGDDSVVSEHGIVQNHAYSLLRGLVLDIDGQSYRLVKLRNPWGNTESKAKFSDSDPIWDQVSEEQKQELGYVKENDGCFFMEFSDFLQAFCYLSIAKVVDGYSYVSSVQQSNIKNASYFKIVITQEGQYTFSFSQTNRRFYPKGKDHNGLTLLVGRLEEAGIKYLKGAFENNEVVSVTHTLPAGEYVAYCKNNNYNKVEVPGELVLSAYGVGRCKIQPSSGRVPVLPARVPPGRGPADPRGLHAHEPGGDQGEVRVRRGVLAVRGGKRQARPDQHAHRLGPQALLPLQAAVQGQGAAAQLGQRSALPGDRALQGAQVQGRGHQGLQPGQMKQSMRDGSEATEGVTLQQRDVSCEDLLLQEAETGVRQGRLHLAELEGVQLGQLVRPVLAGLLLVPLVPAPGPRPPGRDLGVLAADVVQVYLLHEFDQPHELLPQMGLVPGALLGVVRQPQQQSLEVPVPAGLCQDC
jgi:hypothetical protein